MARQRSLVRRLPVLLGLAVGLVLGLVSGLVLAGVLVRTGNGAARPVRAARPAGGPADPGPMQVLRLWDTARAEAYAAGDEARLRHLYVPGSSAGVADLRLLQRYRSRGLRVVGMRTQVLDFTTLAAGPARWHVRVTDRLVGAVAVRPGARLVLPRDEASTRVLTLVRGSGGSWRVSRVTGSR